MTSRRTVALATGSGLLLAHQLGRAQATIITRKVGIISLSSEAVGALTRNAFIQGMSEFGKTRRQYHRHFRSDRGDASQIDWP